MLKKSHKEYWDAYINTLPENERPSAPTIEAAPCGNHDITDELIALYLDGKKTAGSGLAEDYKYCNDPLPKIGNYWIVLDSQDKPKLICKTLKVEFNRFGDIPAYIAKAEGEGDCSIQYWKDVHSKIYAPHLKTWGIEDINDATVVTEFFEVVYK